MADTDNVTFNRPADRLLAVVQLEHERMNGKTLNKKQLYEASVAVIRRRLGIDTFEEKKGKK